NPSAEQLAGIIIATGLAQNLAALRALVSTGIQAGHMALQAKSLAIQVGAMNDEVEQLVAQLNQTNQINAAMARQLLQKMRDSHAEN
ncbi:3-hydroxy-3-methylglutaryl-CoA reductase, partial [Lactobacillus sp. UMNPBX19]